MITAADQPTIDILIENPIPIIDGYVTIRVGGNGPGGLTIKARVKQVKGRGVHDAAALVVPNENHLEVLGLLYIRQKDGNTPFTSKTIYEELNHARKKRYLETGEHYVEMPRPTHTRTMSELLKKEIIQIVAPAVREGLVDKHAPYYVLNPIKAQHVLVTRRFE